MTEFDPFDPSKESENWRDHLILVKSLARRLNGDGCTGAPDFWYRHDCDEHDVHYRTGKDVNGRPISRMHADAKLMIGMYDHSRTFIGRQIISPLYFIAVRWLGWLAWKGDK